MIYSDLAGKNHVPEDVFTSNCLGLLRLLGSSDLLAFFNSARSLQQEPLAVAECSDDECILKFWPYLPGGGIPDAIIEVSGPRPFRIIVESKHGAPKSGAGDDDQLARYLRAAKAIYLERCPVAVVYLTHHREFPKKDIKLSLDYAGKEESIFWLSRYELFRWLEAQLSASASRTAVEKRILIALRDYLAEYGYRVFLGWGASMPAFPIEPIYRRSFSPGITFKTIPRFVRAYGRVPSGVDRFPSLELIRG
jgi:hypothetical protein